MVFLVLLLERLTDIVTGSTPNRYYSEFNDRCMVFLIHLPKLLTDIVTIFCREQQSFEFGDRPRCQEYNSGVVPKKSYTGL